VLAYRPQKSREQSSTLDRISGEKSGISGGKSGMKCSLEKNQVLFEKNPVKMEKNPVSIRCAEGKKSLREVHMFDAGAKK
jgi:hypothetical protein